METNKLTPIPSAHDIGLANRRPPTDLADLDQAAREKDARHGRNITRLSGLSRKEWTTADHFDYKELYPSGQTMVDAAQPIPQEPEETPEGNQGGEGSNEGTPAAAAAGGASALPAWAKTMIDANPDCPELVKVAAADAPKAVREAEMKRIIASKKEGTK